MGDKTPAEAYGRGFHAGSNDGLFRGFGLGVVATFVLSLVGYGCRDNYQLEHYKKTQVDLSAGIEAVENRSRKGLVCKLNNGHDMLLIERDDDRYYLVEGGGRDGR